MNICFIAVFDKTYLFANIAKKLQNEDNNIFWITTSRKLKKYLVKSGFVESRILLIEKSSEYTAKSEVDIESFEHVNDLSLHKLYFMDRLIKDWKWTDAEKYFKLTINNVDNFILTNNIKLIFGETTAAHEILISSLCKYRSINFFNPFTIRIPGDRFAFFKNRENKDFYEFRSPIYVASDDEIVSLIDDLKAGGKKSTPEYFIKNNTKPKYNHIFFYTSIKRFISSIQESRHNASMKTLRYHIFKEPKWLRPINYILSKIFKVFDNQISSKPYVLYTLHKQPEASIDVLGTDWQNQYELIKHISMNIPSEYNIYVKEHSNALGDRSVKYLKKIKRIPGVKLISPFADTKKLILDAEIVFTVSGTVAYEASLLGVKNITFGNMFFNDFSSSYNHRILEKYTDILKTNKCTFSISDFEKMKTIYANSFEGIITTDKDLISESSPNLLKIVEAFKRLINDIKIDEERSDGN